MLLGQVEAEYLDPRNNHIYSQWIGLNYGRALSYILGGIVQCSVLVEKPAFSEFRTLCMVKSNIVQFRHSHNELVSNAKSNLDKDMEMPMER